MKSPSRLGGLCTGDGQMRARSGSCTSRDAAECSGGDSDGDNGKDVGAAATTAACSPTCKQASLASFGQQHTEDGATATAAAETINSCCGNHNTDTTAAWPVLSSGGDETEVATVTVMVPTMFTTAGGRCICVREKRRIACESPYWRLLFGCPLQEGVAVSSHTDGEARLKRQKVRGDADDAERQQRGLLPAWQRHPREANTPFVPSLTT
ncbi:hypothetical protein TraAM80_07580, partial [Trypanosoma rangeli]